MPKKPEKNKKKTKSCYPCKAYRKPLIVPNMGDNDEKQSKTTIP